MNTRLKVKVVLLVGLSVCLALGAWIGVVRATSPADNAVNQTVAMLKSAGVDVSSATVEDSDPLVFHYDVNAKDWSEYLWSVDTVYRTLAVEKAAQRLAVDRVSLSVAAPGNQVIELRAAVEPLVEPEQWLNGSQPLISNTRARALALANDLGVKYGIRDIQASIDYTGGIQALRVSGIVGSPADVSQVNGFVRGLWSSILEENRGGTGVGVGFAEIDDAAGVGVLKELQDFVIGYNIAHSDTDYLEKSDELW